MAVDPKHKTTSETTSSPRVATSLLLGQGDGLALQQLAQAFASLVEALEGHDATANAIGEVVHVPADRSCSHRHQFVDESHYVLPSVHRRLQVERHNRVLREQHFRLNIIVHQPDLARPRHSVEQVVVNMILRLHLITRKSRHSFAPKCLLLSLLVSL